MVNRFMVVGQVVLMWAVGLLMPAALGMTLAAEEKRLVEIGDVTVEKVKENVFRVTVKGIVPTLGWVVNLHPAIYVRPPEVWEIEAVGIKPTGFVPQVITPWVASVEMHLPEETRHVAVKGTVERTVQTITKPVPW